MAENYKQLEQKAYYEYTARLESARLKHEETVRLAKESEKQAFIDAHQRIEEGNERLLECKDRAERATIKFELLELVRGEEKRVAEAAEASREAIRQAKIDEEAEQAQARQDYEKALQDIVGLKEAKKLAAAGEKRSREETRQKKEEAERLKREEEKKALSAKREEEEKEKQRLYLQRQAEEEKKKAEKEARRFEEAENKRKKEEAARLARENKEKAAFVPKKEEKKPVAQAPPSAASPAAKTPAPPPPKAAPRTPPPPPVYNPPMAPYSAAAPAPDESFTGSKAAPAAWSVIPPGTVMLVISAASEYAAVRELENGLGRWPDMKLVLTGGEDTDIKMIVALTGPVNVAERLSSLDIVQDIYKEGETFRLSLKSSIS